MITSDEEEYLDRDPPDEEVTFADAMDVLADMGVASSRFNVRHAVATWNERDENGIHTVAACGCGWTTRAEGVADILLQPSPIADAMLVAIGLHSIGES